MWRGQTQPRLQAYHGSLGLRDLFPNSGLTSDFCWLSFTERLISFQYGLSSRWPHWLLAFPRKHADRKKDRQRQEERGAIAFLTGFWRDTTTSAKAAGHTDTSQERGKKL